MIAREATLGASMGWILGMVLVPVRIAGAYVAQEMGLTIATLTSSTGEGNSNVLSEILDAMNFCQYGKEEFITGVEPCRPFCCNCSDLRGR